MSLKNIELVTDVPRKVIDPGLSVAQINHNLIGNFLDPYLMVDHFFMSAPFFPPHPHAGFSAVTYMFPESAGGFLNRDSLGNEQAIDPGAIHWTVAGRGVIHEEVPSEPGVVCSGLQIFVNLHSTKKQIDPYSLHADAAEIPRVVAEGSEVRVVVGEYDGTRSAFVPPTDVLLLDVVLEEGATFTHTLPSGMLGFIYVLEGHGLVQSLDVREQQVAGLSLAGERLEVTSASWKMQFVLAVGRPLKEPVVFHGPFCMNTREQIDQAIRDYQHGRMGSLKPSF